MTGSRLAIQRTPASRNERRAARRSIAEDGAGLEHLGPWYEGLAAPARDRIDQSIGHLDLQRRVLGSKAEERHARSAEHPQTFLRRSRLEDDMNVVADRSVGGSIQAPRAV